MMLLLFYKRPRERRQRDQNQHLRSSFHHVSRSAQTLRVPQYPQQQVLYYDTEGSAQEKFRRLNWSF